MTASAAAEVFPQESWQTKAPREVNLDADKLNAFAKAVGGDGVVVRDGYLVKTWGKPDRRADWASSCKPVISTLLLFAVQEGKLKSRELKVNQSQCCFSQKVAFRSVNRRNGVTLTANPAQRMLAYRVPSQFL